MRPAASVEAVVRAMADVGPRGALVRGLGRSYGDMAQNAGGLVIDARALSSIEELDSIAGTATVLAGTSIDALLRRTVPDGWFVPVSPGTRFVTIGGAIANDVHGKNHHREGSFGAHVLSFDLLTADGTIRTVTPDDDPDTFAATTGGGGLTGAIVRATIRLLPIQTSRVRVDTERASDLDDMMARMDAGDDAYRYSVAWLDTLARGRSLGQGVLTRGDHAEPGEVTGRGTQDPLAYRPRLVAVVPSGVPRLVSDASMRAFNEAWFRRTPRERRGGLKTIPAFFHPLDAVGGWNRLYGRSGFVQYQFVVPFGAETVIRSVIERLVARKVASFLGVLKRFGPGSGMLSFPIKGWTLAIDIPAGQAGLRELLARFDEDVAAAGGRVYLAKDARLMPELLGSMYPELERWRTIRERLDPGGVWQSDLARRVGLLATERVRTDAARA